jgi:hypothetical protein
MDFRGSLTHQPTDDRRFWAVLRGRSFYVMSRKLRRMSFSTESAKSSRSMRGPRTLGGSFPYCGSDPLGVNFPVAEILS